jgi:hypothetical protein
MDLLLPSMREKESWPSCLSRQEKSSLRIICVVVGSCKPGSFSETAFDFHSYSYLPPKLSPHLQQAGSRVMPCHHRRFLHGDNESLGQAFCGFFRSFSKYGVRGYMTYRGRVSPLFTGRFLKETNSFASRHERIHDFSEHNMLEVDSHSE